MSYAQAQQALSALSTSLVAEPELEYAMRARWRTRVRTGRTVRPEPEMPPDLRAAADQLTAVLPPLTHSEADVAALGSLFAQPCGAALLCWCSASAWRR